MGKNAAPLRPLSVFLLFTALGVVYSWPLAQHLLDGIPYGYDADPKYATSRLFMGDHLQYYYHLGLLKHAALGHIEWFTNPLEFATEYQPKWFFSYSLPLSITYLPFALYSMPLAYNMFVLLSFGLGGLSMYLWGAQLTKNRMAGLVAGFVFNFFPIRMVELLGGHPSGFVVFLVPLTLFFFDRAVERKSVWNSAFAGLSAFILAFQYNYFAYYLLMFLMAYIPWRLVPAIASARSEAEGMKKLAVAVAPFALGLVAAVGWMYHYKKSIVEHVAVAAGRTLGEVSLYSPPLSSAWDTSRGWYVYIGATAAAGIFGLLCGLFCSKRKTPAKWDILFFFVVFTVTYILSFGVTLDDEIPLYSLFYNYFPYFKFSRSPWKIMILAMTALSALSAYMAVWFSGVKSGKAILRLAGVLLLAVVAVDFHPRKSIGVCLLDEGNETYEFIQQTANGKPILNLPIWPGESSWEAIYQYYAVQSGVPMINGYSPMVKQEYIDNIFWPLFPMNVGDMSEKQVELVRRLGTSYIVFHADAFPPKVSAYSPYFSIKRLMGSPYLELVRKDDPLWVFRLKDEPALKTAHEVISPVGKLYQAESLVKIFGKPVEDKDAANGWALFGDPARKKNPEEILNAGPYTTFPGGNYKATFRVKVSDNTAEEPVLTLDVAGDSGKKVVATREIRGTDFEKIGEYQDITIEYYLTPGEPWQIEFRTYITGDAAVWVDDVYVRFADTKDPQYFYEAEDLQYYSGRLVEDEEASGEKAVRSAPGENPADLMVFGPDRLFGAGKYTASVRTKPEHPQLEETIAELVALSGSTGKELARKKIQLSDLRNGEGSYSEAALPFTLAGASTVEIQVFFTGSAPISVDSISIKPKTNRR